jgi:hypothetical protein
MLVFLFFLKIEWKSAYSVLFKKRNLNVVIPVYFIDKLNC